MARFQLWVRKYGQRDPVQLWTGALSTDQDGGRTYDQALGSALRSCSDAVLRDTNTTDPATRVRVLFTRHGPGEFQDD